MALRFSYLYAAPDVNPVTRKARSIPALNPVNAYGRVFFFSWFSFMVAFWAWYTFPPLVRHVSNVFTLRDASTDKRRVFPQLTATIKDDLHLTPTQVANSNIVSLCVT